MVVYSIQYGEGIHTVYGGLQYTYSMVKVYCTYCIWRFTVYIQYTYSKHISESNSVPPVIKLFLCFKVDDVVDHWFESRISGNVPERRKLQKG